nr:ABC transporter ATP-binding protein [Pseudomonas sp.]
MTASTQGDRSHGAAPLLDVRGLRIFFGQPGREVEATRDVTFALYPGERVGLVGESGCGKTVTGLSILGLLPSGSSRLEGSIEFDGRNLLALSARELRRIRGNEIGMIFQEPMSALDPVFTIGEQIMETLHAHRKMGAREAREQAIDALAQVGIPAPERRVDEYPHQLSGGMRQRDGDHGAL